MKTYEEFLSGTLPQDAYLLAVMAAGEVTKTTDDTQAAEYEQRCQRLFGDGYLIRYQQGQERANDGTVWYTIEGRVEPYAAGYAARACAERVEDAQSQPEA